MNDETIEKSIINQGVVSCFLGIFGAFSNFLLCGSIGIVRSGCGWTLKTRFLKGSESWNNLVYNFWKDVSIQTALFQKGVLSFQGIILSSLTYRSSRVEYITQLTGGLLSHLYWRSRKVANYRHPLPIPMMKENHKFWMGVMGEDSPHSWKSTKKLQKQSVHVCTVYPSQNMLIRKKNLTFPPPKENTHCFKMILRLGTLLGTNMSPPKVWFENDVPFPVWWDMLVFLGANSYTWMKLGHKQTSKPPITENPNTTNNKNRKNKKKSHLKIRVITSVTHVQDLWIGVSSPHLSLVFRGPSSTSLGNLSPTILCCQFSIQLRSKVLNLQCFRLLGELDSRGDTIDGQISKLV